MSGIVGTNSGHGSGTIGTSSAGADTDLSNLSADGEKLACQAWANINGTGTAAITNSGGTNGFSSMTDNSTGNYTLTFASTMADATYAIAGSNIGSDPTLHYTCALAGADAASTTTAFTFEVRNIVDHAVRDMDKVNIMVFGD